LAFFVFVQKEPGAERSPLLVKLARYNNFPSIRTRAISPIFPQKPRLAICLQKCKIDVMRILLATLVGSVLLITGCTDRPELAPSAYGVIRDTLPELEKANEPFPFPIGKDGNDHQNCVFNEEDFL